jgi:hypothetical protein
MKLRHINNTIVEKKNDFFTYVELSKDMWREKINDEQDAVGIHFDLENDDGVTQREIIVDQDHWEHTKCKFRCELCKAGGDWQSPVIYFRCQLRDGYARRNDKDMYTSGDSHFIYIPAKHDGNINLEKTEKGWSAPDSDCKTKPNEYKAWQALKKYLRKLVDDAIATTDR